MATPKGERVISLPAPEASRWQKLGEAVEDLANTLDQRELGPKLLGRACDLTAAEKGVLVLKERGGWGYRLYQHPGSEGVADGKLLLDVKGLLGEVLADGVPRQGRPADCAEAEPCFPGTRDFLAVPLKAKGFLLGALAVADKLDGSPFSELDQEVLLILASQGALALENAYLYEQADERLQEKVAELHTLNLVLRGQQSLLQRSADLYRQLTELVLCGQGLAAICQALYQIVQVPLVVEDEHYRVLASTGLAEGEGHVSLGDFPANEVDRPRVHLGRKATRLPLGRGGPFRAQVVVPLVAGEEVLGYLYALEADRPLGTMEQMALENAGTVLTLELLKSRVARETELRLRADFLEKVLSGAYKEEPVLEAQARRLGLSLRGNYQVLLVRAGQDGSPAEAAVALEQAFKTAGTLAGRNVPNCFLTDDGRQVVMIAPLETGTAQKQLEDLAWELVAELEKQGIEAWCGLSGLGKRPGDLRRLYGEAFSALEIMQAVGRRKRVMRYADLGIFGFLSVDKERFLDFTRRVLGPLMEYDRQHQLNLLETLNLYFQNNCNLQQTARAGYMGLSTVKYRLRRIHQITGLDLDDPDTRLQVQLALKLLL